MDDRTEMEGNAEWTKRNWRWDNQSFCVEGPQALDLAFDKRSKQPDPKGASDMLHEYAGSPWVQRVHRVVSTLSIGRRATMHRAYSDRVRTIYKP